VAGAAGPVVDAELEIVARPRLDEVIGESAGNAPG
jgi:hypothetical protein